MTDKLQNIFSLIAEYSGYIKLIHELFLMPRKNYGINTQLNSYLIIFYLAVSNLITDKLQNIL